MSKRHLEIRSMKQKKMVLIIYQWFISKSYSLLEQARKKPEKLLPEHVYHHATIQSSTLEAGNVKPAVRKSLFKKTAGL